MGLDTTDLVRRRFWDRVEVRAEDECWPWLGSKLKKDGRGVLAVKSKNVTAPRVSWMLHFGDIAAGLFVCHSCDNPSCVNPRHLWLGTVKDNAADASRKGRTGPQIGKAARGSKHGNAKLTEDDVRIIKEKLAAKVPHRAIAREFGVALCSISVISNGTGWTHVK